MNSRTIHTVLFSGIITIFLVGGTQVYAQAHIKSEQEAPPPPDTQQKPSTPYISTQLPIIIDDVGEEINTKQKETTPKVTITPQPTKKVSEPKTEATPTKTPTPTQTPSPTSTQQTTNQTMKNTGGLDPEKLFAMSNAYRKERGLPEFQKDDKTCSLAASRAPEISAEIASGDMHSGLRARNLDYWNTENIISMRTEESAFNWWVNDKIHHDAIVGNFTYSCVACSGNSCAQEFTNYQPK